MDSVVGVGMARGVGITMRWGGLRIWGQLAVVREAVFSTYALDFLRQS